MRLITIFLLALLALNISAAPTTGRVAGTVDATEVIDSTDHALDVYNRSNPSAHNPSLGALQTTRAGTTNYYTTTGDKLIYVGAGSVESITAASGTSVTVTLFDDGDTTCNSNQKTGVVPLTNGTPIYPGWEVGTGICINIGGTSPTVTIVTLP